jgi:hypothetical protein
VHVYFKQAMGAPPKTAGSTSTWAFQLRWSAWVDRGRWPELIVFAVPIACALRAAMRPDERKWAWVAGRVVEEGDYVRRRVCPGGRASERAECLH